MTRESSIRRKTHQPLSYNLLQLNVIKRSRQPFTVLVLAVNLLWLEDSCNDDGLHAHVYASEWGLSVARSQEAQEGVLSVSELFICNAISRKK